MLAQGARVLLQGMVWEGTPCVQAPLAVPVAHRSGGLGLSLVCLELAAY